MYKIFKSVFFDLRIALAMYMACLQLLPTHVNAQSQDPGSFQSQTVQRRAQEAAEDQASRTAAVRDRQKAKEKSYILNERQEKLGMKGLSKAEVTRMTFDTPDGEQIIYIGDDNFDKLVQKSKPPKYSTAREMPLSQIAQQMIDIKEDSTQYQKYSDNDEWKRLEKNASDYKAYQQEMSKLESGIFGGLESGIFGGNVSGKLLNYAVKTQTEQVAQKNIISERTALQNKSFGNVVHEANVRFPKDTAMFFVMIGAVIATELIFKNGGDPLAMQHHFESLTDPIANLSFYSFILANGISLHYLKLGASKKLIDMNHRLLFSSLPMISMPFASLVSNIVSDTAMTIQACADEIMDPKKAAKKKSDEDLIYTACEENLRQWTFTDKANQYIPQLISLSLSNAPFILLGHGTKKITEKIQAKAMLGIESTVARIGGRVLMTGLKFMLSPVPAIALDMLIANPMSTRWYSTKVDDYRIESAKKRIFENANNCNWELQGGGSGLVDMPKACLQLKEDTLILRDRSQSWRNTINSDFEAGFHSWSKIMMKFNNQFNAAQGFYSYVFNLILDYNFSKTMCDTYKVLRHCEYMDTVFGLQTFLLTKHYPLIGAKVNRNAFNSSAEGDSDEEYALKLKNAFSDFAMNPKFLKAQVANIHEQTEAFLQSPTLVNITNKTERKFVNIMFQNLLSNKPSIIAQGFLELNKIFTSVMSDIHSGVRPEFKTFMIAFRQAVGNVQNGIGSFGEGFLLARSHHVQFDDARTTTEYEVHSPRNQTFKFPTTAHYFLHEMICGEENAQRLSLLDFGRKIGKVNETYVPPRLIKDPQAAVNLCHSSVIDMNYGMTFSHPKLFGLKDKNGYDLNPTLFLLNNYNEPLFRRINENGDLLGFYLKDGLFIPKNRNSYFGDWWTNVNKIAVDKFLQEAKEDWKRIYTELILGFKNRGYVQDPSQRVGIVKSAKGWASDGTSQPKNALDVIQVETNIYFDLLKKLNLTDTSQKTMRRWDAVVEYVHVQNQTIEFLQKIFDNDGSISERNVVAASERLPDEKLFEEKQKTLAEAMSQLKTFFTHAETLPLVKSVNSDIIYAIEASNNDLNKYLQAAYIIGFKDKETLRLMREKAKEEQQKAKLNSQGQGVRRSGK